MMSRSLPPKSVGLFVLLALFGFSSGCQTVGEILKDAPKPTASIKAVRLSKIDLAGVDLDFDVEITNPYSVDAPIAGIGLGLSTTGTKFLDARANDVGSIPAKGSKVTTMSAKVAFAELLQAVKEIRPGAVVPYKAAFDVAMDAPVVGRINIPIEHEDKFPVPNVPEVGIKNIAWKKLDFTEATGVVSLEIGNTNQFPVSFRNMSYGFALSGARIGNLGVDKDVQFQPQGKTTIDIPITLKPMDLGMAFFNTIRSGKIDYRLDGNLAGETPFGPISFPVAKGGTTSLK